MLTVAESHALAEVEKIERLEGAMLECEQVPCPVEHIFGPGLYIRQVTLPAGAVAVGHMQRQEHLNVLLSGVVAMVEGDSVRVVKAPLVYVGKPGRKIGYVIETAIWQNIYATDERDIETLEKMFLEKSETSKAHAEISATAEHCARQADREDFEKLIAAAGFSAELVRSQSENETDMIPMPSEFASRYTVRSSAIEGRGGFCSSPMQAGEVIAPARLAGMRTPAGRFTNHSAAPNADLVMVENGDVWLIARRDINGSVGGSSGEEITVNYRQSLALSGIEVLS